MNNSTIDSTPSQHCQRENADTLDSNTLVSIPLKLESPINELPPNPNLTYSPPDALNIVLERLMSEDLILASYMRSVNRSCENFYQALRKQDRPKDYSRKKRFIGLARYLSVPINLLTESLRDLPNVQYLKLFEPSDDRSDIVQIEDVPFPPECYRFEEAEEGPLPSLGYVEIVGRFRSRIHVSKDNGVHAEERTETLLDDHGKTVMISIWHIYLPARLANLKVMTFAPSFTRLPPALRSLDAKLNFDNILILLDVGILPVGISHIDMSRTFIHDLDEAFQTERRVLQDLEFLSVKSISAGVAKFLPAVFNTLKLSNIYQSLNLHSNITELSISYGQDARLQQSLNEANLVAEASNPVSLLCLQSANIRYLALTSATFWPALYDGMRGESQLTSLELHGVRECDLSSFSNLRYLKLYDMETFELPQQLQSLYLIRVSMTELLRNLEKLLNLVALHVMSENLNSIDLFAGKPDPGESASIVIRCIFETSKALKLWSSDTLKLILCIAEEIRVTLPPLIYVSAYDFDTESDLHQEYSEVTHLWHMRREGNTKCVFDDREFVLFDGIASVPELIGHVEEVLRVYHDNLAEDNYPLHYRGLSFLRETLYMLLTIRLPAKNDWDCLNTSLMRVQGLGNSILLKWWVKAIDEPLLGHWQEMMLKRAIPVDQ